MGLFDVSTAETASGAFLNGREFTIVTAAADANGDYYIPLPGKTKYV